MTSDGGLSVSDIVRTFNKGKFLALDRVSLDVNSGQIVGLLGPNGAGKTTLVRICSTLLTPDFGSVTVGGIDAVRNPKKARGALGVVLGGDLGFYPRASAKDNLLFFADVAGLGKNRRQEVNWALEQVNLADRADDKVNAFSRGMKQRLHIARAILGHPSVLLLDEPTSGLDPEIAVGIRGLIRSLADSGTAILLTSHTMTEVESLADQIVVIGAGRVAVRGKVSDVAQAAGVGSVSAFTFPALDSDLRARIEALNPVSIDVVANDGQVVVRVMWSSDDENGDRGLRAILESSASGKIPQDFIHRPPTLEEGYLGLAPRLVRR
jgi:ABC-2 type transport system ATP-binding protein